MESSQHHNSVVADNSVAAAPYRAPLPAVSTVVEAIVVVVAVAVVVVVVVVAVASHNCSLTLVSDTVAPRLQVERNPPAWRVEH